MPIDAVKPKFQSPVFIRLQQCGQRRIIGLAQQDCGVDALNPGIHAGKLRQAVERLELSHAVPFHCSVPRVVNGVTAARIEDCADDACEHGFVLFRRGDPLEVPRQVEGRRVRCYPKDGTVLQDGEQIGLCLDTGGQVHPNRLGNPKVTVPMRHTAGKSMIVKRGHIIAVCVRMYPFQYGESALTETNRFGIPDAGHLQQLYPHPLIGIRVTKLLCCGKFTHQRSESTLVSQHAKRTDRVFAGEPKHCDKPMHMTSRPNGNHCFKPRNAGAFRQHDCSLCRKPSAQNA